MTKAGMEFRVLGPLEVWCAGEQLVVGGAKQRAVLAALLLRTGEVVPVDRLVDDVWGDEPPPSAARTIESYVSRLRHAFNGHGPTLARRGTGYALDLHGATLDADSFRERLEQASLASSLENHAKVVELAIEAIRLWRGPALADVALASAGRVEAEQLEELRLRTYELRFDAELALGCHESVVSELPTLVAQSPYRERFVAQLMLGLYRSGRQAEALDVYEQTRRRLDEDLGLQPSVELRELSGRMVRQERQLLRPTLRVRERDGNDERRTGRATRLGALVCAGAATAAVMAFTASGSASSAPGAAPAAQRVALVLPASPETAIEEPRIRESADAFRSSATAWDLQGDVLVADEGDPSGRQIEQVASLLEENSYALAIVVGDKTSRALAPVARRSATHFVFLDASLATLALRGLPNGTGMPFADEETSHLMGFLSAVVPLRGDPPGRSADVVSIVVSNEDSGAARLVEAFGRGASRAASRAKVRAVYVTDESDKTACERVANDLVDSGADVVYANAGECSTAVLAVAKLRGVWGIRANDDPFAYGPHIIATTYKRWSQAVRSALNGFALATLPRGRDVVLGLADDYAVDAWGSGAPESNAVWSDVFRVCTSIRQRTEDDAP